MAKFLILFALIAIACGSPPDPNPFTVRTDPRPAPECIYTDAYYFQNKLVACDPGAPVCAFDAGEHATTTDGSANPIAFVCSCNGDHYVCGWGGAAMNVARLAKLLAEFALEHPHRPLSTVTAAEFALWFTAMRRR